MYDDDEDDEDQDERESQEYECQNKGCFNPNGTTFEAAPESWFEEKGLSTPTNCGMCRSWIAEQKEMGPIVAICVFCGYQWAVAATYRISYHKYVGNWGEYWEKEQNRLCMRCIELPHRRLQLKIRHAEKTCRDAARKRGKYLGKTSEQIRYNNEERQKDSDLILSYGSYPNRYDVPVDAVFYARIKTSEERVDVHGDTQLDHILKIEHEWQELGDMSLPDAILSTASHIARAQSNRIREFDAGNGIIAKYDTDQMIVVLIKRDRRSTSGFRIETAFPSKSAYVLRKVESGRWR